MFNISKSILLFCFLLVGCGEPDGFNQTESSKNGTTNNKSSGAPFNIKKFQMTEGAYATCVAGTKKKNGHIIKVNQTLILVDLTDKLLPNQIQYVKDNWINNIAWKKRGDIFAMARMTKQPPEQMKVISVCAPDPVNLDDSAMNKGNNKTFKKSYNTIFTSLLKPNGIDADNSLLIESIKQIYTNARYKFSSKNGPRHLILVSDLYQNSSEISFFKCNPKDKECSFSNTKKKKADWFNSARLNLTKEDKVTIYHLSSKCRVDLSAKDWWVSYFKSEGAGQVEVISELGTNQCQKKVKFVEEVEEVIVKVPVKKEVYVEEVEEVIVKVPVKKEVYVEEVEEVIVKVPVKKEVYVEEVEEVIIKSSVCGEDGKAGPNTFQKDIFC
jgi:hypothetical protein